MGPGLTGSELLSKAIEVPGGLSSFVKRCGCSFGHMAIYYAPIAA
jgi:hypothetical protein